MRGTVLILGPLMFWTGPRGGLMPSAYIEDGKTYRRLIWRFFRLER